MTRRVFSIGQGRDGQPTGVAGGRTHNCGDACDCADADADRDGCTCAVCTDDPTPEERRKRQELERLADLVEGVEARDLVADADHGDIEAMEAAVEAGREWVNDRLGAADDGQRYIYDGGAPVAHQAAEGYEPTVTTEPDPAKDPAAGTGPGTIGTDHLAVGRPTITQRRARRERPSDAADDGGGAAQWRGSGVNYAGLSGGRARRQDADADRDGWTPVVTTEPQE